MKNSDLKSCPFCGNEKLTIGFFGNLRAVVCSDCGAQGPMQSNSIFAEEGWEGREV